MVPSDERSGSYLPDPLGDICLHLATCLGVTMTFTREPGKVIVCTLFFKLSHLKKNLKVRILGRFVLINGF